MWRERRNSCGWGPCSPEQICPRATMGRTECKEEAAYGISAPRLSTPTAQGLLLLLSENFLHPLPLLAARPRCRCCRLSDGLPLFAVRMSLVYRAGGGGKKSHQMEDDQTDSRRCHRGWRDPYPQISCSQTVLLYLQILAFSLWLVDNQMGPLLDLNAETQCKCFDERVGAMLKGVTSITGRPLYLQADKRP